MIMATGWGTGLGATYHAAAVSEVLATAHAVFEEGRAAREFARRCSSGP
jgi:hypothetical protein